MIGINVREEIIRLISNGFSLELLSFELGIPIEEVKSCYDRLELRRFAKNSIKNGNIALAIERLEEFVCQLEESDSIIEKLILLKLKAYAKKSIIDEKDLLAIETLRKKLKIKRSLDEILTALDIQIPECKNDIIKLEQKRADISETDEIEYVDYQQLIDKYRKELLEDTTTVGKVGTRRLLAYALSRAGRIEEAREELMDLIETEHSYLAYKQIIYLEMKEENYDEAKLWAYECLDYECPRSISIDIREQLISIANKEGDFDEVIKQLRDIIGLYPDSKRHLKKLKIIEKGQGR